MAVARHVVPADGVLAAIGEALRSCGTEELQEGQLNHRNWISISVNIGELFALSVLAVPTARFFFVPGGQLHRFKSFIRVQTGLPLRSEVAENLNGVSMAALVWVNPIFTILVFWMAQHQLLACAGRTLEGPEWFSHELHLCFH